MKKKKIIIISIISVFICLLFYILHLQTELAVYTKSREIKGTFQTITVGMRDSHYIVFDTETNECYWYKQNTFYNEGKYKKLNNENIYMLTFDEENMYFIDYNKNDAILINGEEAIKLIKIADVPTFIGIQDLKNPK